MSENQIPDELGVHEAARREKLQKIAAMGIDPWGGRFDERMLIGEIRSRKSEIRYVREAGGAVEIPDRRAPRVYPAAARRTSSKSAASRQRS